MKTLQVDGNSKMLTLIQRKYYKYQETSWVQPTIYDNGTIGGSWFAVKCDQTPSGQSIGPDSGQQIWRAFDNNSSTRTQYNYKEIQIIMSNPVPIKITGFAFTCYSTYYVKSGTLYGSNDGTNYTQIDTITNTSGTKDFSVTISNTNYYKYYKLNTVSNVNITGIIQIDITATYQKVIDGTSSDYDYYVDVDTYKALS